MFIMVAVTVALGAEISGVIGDEYGEPIEGASVYILDNRLGYAGDYTDELGQFFISGVPERDYRIWVVPAADSNYPARFAPSGWSYCDGEPVSLGEAAVEGFVVELPEGGVVSGRVEYTDGSGHSGVTVELRGVDNRVSGVRRSGVTNSDGEFTVNGLDGDFGQTSTYEVRLHATDFPSQELGGLYNDGETVQSGIGSDEDIGEFQLLSGIVVEGTIAGPDGPLGEAAVYVYSESQVTTVYTDSTGKFSANALPPGEVLPWASLEGFGLTYYPDNDRPTEWVASGGEGTTLSGVDLQMPYAAPLGVSLQNDGSDMSGVSGLAYIDDFTVGVGAASDESGMISMNRLHSGSWAVFIYAADEGYVNDFVRDESGEIRMFSLPAEGAEYSVELPRGASISGVITDDAGEPVYGATVYLSPEDERLHTVNGKSDHLGAYEIDGVVPGVYKMEVRYSVYCDSDPGYVRSYWPGEVAEGLSQTFELTDGDEALGVNMEVPVDSDHDGMSDLWEEEFGLSVGLDDGDLDLDEDGFSNLEEYLLGTDPAYSVVDSTSCGGCSSSSGDSPLERRGLLVWLVLAGGVLRARCRT